MKTPRTSAGFTLVELMVAITIFTLVSVAVCTALVGGNRLLKIAFSEAELSIRTRELRDKLLFHAAPPHDGTIWAGLLSGTNRNQCVEGNGSKILLRCPAHKGSSVLQSSLANQTIELRFANAGSQSCSLFSEDRYDANAETRWLHPGKIDFFAGRPAPSDIVVVDSDDAGRFYINVTARKNAGGFAVEHNERIVVPVFGRTQKTRADGNGGL